MSISVKFLVNKLGRLLILGRIFITQTVRSSPTSCFPDCWKVLLVIPVFKNIGERSTVKNYHPVSLLSVVNKVFEKPVKMELLISWRNVAFFLIFRVVLGLLDQLQIFLQLYLKELLGLLTGLGLNEL